MLDKPERRLVLQMIDAKDQIAEDKSIDSFITGFRLILKLRGELNMYAKTCPLLTDKELVCMDTFVVSEKMGREAKMAAYTIEKLFYGGK